MIPIDIWLSWSMVNVKGQALYFMLEREGISVLQTSKLERRKDKWMNWF